MPKALSIRIAAALGGAALLAACATTPVETTMDASGAETEEAATLNLADGTWVTEDGDTTLVVENGTPVRWTFDGGGTPYVNEDLELRGDTLLVDQGRLTIREASAERLVGQWRLGTTSMPMTFLREG
jgi:hypothetical protein